MPWYKHFLRRKMKFLLSWSLGWAAAATAPTLDSARAKKRRYSACVRGWLTTPPKATASEPLFHLKICKEEKKNAVTTPPSPEWGPGRDRQWQVTREDGNRTQPRWRRGPLRSPAPCVAESLLSPGMWACFIQARNSSQKYAFSRALRPLRSMMQRLDDNDWQYFISMNSGVDILHETNIAATECDRKWMS